MQKRVLLTKNCTLTIMTMSQLYFDYSCNHFSLINNYITVQGQLLHASNYVFIQNFGSRQVGKSYFAAVFARDDR